MVENHSKICLIRIWFGDVDVGFGVSKKEESDKGTRKIKLDCVT